MLGHNLHKCVWICFNIYLKKPDGSTDFFFFFHLAVFMDKKFTENIKEMQQVIG